MVHYLPAYLFHFRHRQTMNRVVTYDRMEVVLIARAVPIQYSSLLQIIQRLAQPVASGLQLAPPPPPIQYSSLLQIIQRLAQPVASGLQLGRVLPVLQQSQVLLVGLFLPLVVRCFLRVELVDSVLNADSAITLCFVELTLQQIGRASCR